MNRRRFRERCLVAEHIRARRVRVIAIMLVVVAGVAAPASAQTATELCRFLPVVRQDRARVTSSNPPQCTVAANTDWPWEIELKRRVDAAAAKSELASRKQAGERDGASISDVNGLGQQAYAIESTTAGASRVQSLTIAFEQGSYFVTLIAELVDSVPPSTRSLMLADARAIDRSLVSATPATSASPGPSASTRSSSPTPTTTTSDPIFDAFGGGVLSDEDLRAISARLKGTFELTGKDSDAITETLRHYGLTTNKVTLLSTFLQMGVANSTTDGSIAFPQVHATVPILLKMLENALHSTDHEELVRIGNAANNLMRITIGTELYGKPAR